MFNLKQYKKPFCYRESKKFKIFEYPLMKDKYFWKFPKKYNSKKFQKLMISGPARNGNHLMISLIDGHKDIATQFGEDSTLTSFLCCVKKDEKKAIENIKNYNSKFVLGLSGQYYPNNKKIVGYDKWKNLFELFKKKRKSNTWSGIQSDGKSFAQDYQDFVPKIDYKKFKKKIMEPKGFKNFFDFWYFYLNAYKILAKKNNVNLKYQYNYAASGSRRELFFILNKTKNIKVLCPIREFSSFYFSFSKSRFNSTKITKKNLKEAWAHWYHKVIDYLILQKKYPKNVLIVKYEDLTNDTISTMRRVAKKLNIEPSKSLFIPTINGKKTKGNSSFKNNKNKFGKIYKNDNKIKLAIKFQNYDKILKYINKIKV
tara:strand:- start:216 stop:1325 length:1110 start_codon:yes stop_codon:yes gene_type:complete